ncbi:MAG: hypothetical protein Q9168_007908 [Polycauliona sp. 1 TL-2023]
MATLNSLPPEIRLGILEICEDVSTAYALARASKTYLSTWYAFSNRILQRTVHCWDLAQALAEAQQQTARYQTYEAYLVCVSWNAKEVELACDFFKEFLISKNHADAADLDTPQERRCFFRAFYRLWTLAVMHLHASKSIGRLPLSATAKYVEVISPVDRLILCEVIRIVLFRMKDPGRVKLGINDYPPHSFWRIVFEFEYHWELVNYQDPSRFPWDVAAIDMLHIILTEGGWETPYDVPGREQRAKIFLNSEQSKLKSAMELGLQSRIEPTL